MNARFRHRMRLSSQRGSTLITATVFLMILTMIVLTALSTGTLEERMAANDRNRQVGLHAAEAILREAEALVLTNTAPFDPFDPTKFTSDCGAASAGDPVGLCDIHAANSDPRWKTLNWSDAAKTRVFANNSSKIAGIADSDQPRYIIELVTAPLKSAQCFGLVNVTARGLGRDNAIVFIQSTVRFQPEKC